ncbi:MAG: aldo/keto reductase [bacterium]|nr:aldo/keto reductase [bacterium]MDE0289885.1 aldo/keto reductase [bacterium]MDE0436835.1 aldo/keto reductase [bacterium]
MATTPPRRRLDGSDLEIYPLALGTNPFSWTADEATSWAVLDAYFDAGGNFLDTADSYPFWAPGNEGGECETIIGRWIKRRGNRDDMVIATKVSHHPEFKGLAPATIRAAVEASLIRLGVDVIDLYYAHFDDPDIPMEESIGTLSGLVDEGKVRYLGVSNYSADRLEEWVRITRSGGFHPPIALQQKYSLVDREVEQTTLPISRREGWAFLPYYALGLGFLTGKYTSGQTVDSPRAGAASAFLNDKGRRILAAMEEVSAAHGVALASVALAWVANRPGVGAAMASARNPEQLEALIDSASLTLRKDEMAALNEASR